MNDNSEDDKASPLDLLFSALGKFAKASDSGRSAPRAATGGAGSIRFGSRGAASCCIAKRGASKPSTPSK